MGMPKTNHTGTKIPEILLISLVWVVLIASPFLFGDREVLDWRSVTKPLETLVPLAIIFLVNRFVMVPYVLFKRKKPLYFRYILIVTTLIAGVTLAALFFTNPLPGKYQLPPPNEAMRPPPAFNQPRVPEPIPPYMNILIFSILLVGFDTGLRLSVKLTRSEQEKSMLEKENTETQLNMLRNQVSPHFFMNTLNNIHALVDINTVEAKEAIIRLSNLMRYLLYDTESGVSSLKNELEFLQSYIDLMKLRFTSNVTISVSLPEKIADKQIPPLLFTAFVENAFKHGISYKTTSFVTIDVTVDENRLIFQVRNSLSDQSKPAGSSGIGIENARKRLDLLFGEQYHLDIVKGEHEFFVYLSVPI